MDSVDNYAHHSALQLAMEAAFISWVKWPDPEKDLFWKAYLERYPHQKNNLMKARAIVSEMRVVSEVINERRAMEVWNRISAQIEEQPMGRRPVKRASFTMSWIRAAAVFIIAVGFAGYFLISRKPIPDVSKTPSYSEPMLNDIAPGSNKAILTLANGQKLVLDSAANGALTTQGNVTLIKLDGQLAYNKENKISESQLLYNTVTTPRGGQYQLVLSDGTRVWLNAASSLHFPTAFAGKERVVEITGEAYFEVSHNPSHPFIVRKGTTEVKVLGTHFNINAYGDEPSLKVTLLNGSVAVSRGSESQLLIPGQQAVIQERPAKIGVISDIDVDHVISWKNGLFDFDDDALPVVMRQLSRWYDAEVRYSGPIPEGHYTGAIRRQANLSEVLKMLETAGGVHFLIEGRQIVVEKKS